MSMIRYTEPTGGNGSREQVAFGEDGGVRVLSHSLSLHSHAEILNASPNIKAESSIRSLNAENSHNEAKFAACIYSGSFVWLEERDVGAAIQSLL